MRKKLKVLVLTGLIISQISMINSSVFADTSVIDKGSTKSVTGDDVWKYLNSGRRIFADGTYATIGANSFTLSGSDNCATVDNTIVIGGSSNVASGELSFIGGGSNNSVSEKYASIIGGGYNTARGQYSLIAGGAYGVASAEAASVFGGYASIASGSKATAVGGRANTAMGEASLTAGGFSNLAKGVYSTIVGGYMNKVSYSNGVIIGGENNHLGAMDAVTLGGISSVNLGTGAISIGGGSISTDASHGIAVGTGSVCTTSDGLALGKQAVQNKYGTISFGHDAGDISGYSVDWKDYSKNPTITTLKYTDAYYNRLVKVADGIDDHDVTTVGQVKAIVAEAGYTAGDGIKISNSNELSISNVIGKNSVADHYQSIPDSSFVIGNNTNIYGYNAIVFGSGVNIKDASKSFIHIGNQSVNMAEISTDSDSYNCNYAIAIGDNSNAWSEGTIAIGKEAFSLGGSTVVLGVNAFSKNKKAIALGTNSSAMEDSVVSVGHKKGDTYYENGSMSNTYSDNLYRRVINVADGIDNNDVATLGQVKKLVKNSSGGTSIKASDDVSISSDNTISIAKDGQIASGDSGIVTGDTVYKVTNKLNAALSDQNTSITAATNKITSLNTSIETLRNSMVQMNTSISNTIADLPNSLGNFINKDLSNLSTDGQNTLKALIKSEIKNQMGTSASNSVSAVSTMDGNFVVQAAADTTYVDNAVAGKADKAELNKLADTVATKADKKDLDALATKVDTKADKTYVDSELAKKADQSTVDVISSKVDTNTKNIAANGEAIKGNTSAIADLKENKADVSGANIDVASWSEKLGTGKVASGDAGLVTGGTVFSALEQKADIGYVNAGFQSMGAQMQEMNQSLTRDINKVGAGAAALAGLHPQEYDPDNKLDFAVGYGHYHNANATALGMYYRPNAVTTLSLAGTIGNGAPMLSAGLSFKLGMGKYVEKVMITKDDFNNMQNRLVAQDNELADQKEEMANQRDRINQQDQEMMAQKEKIEQLEAMVKQLMSK